jgi:hypothetical protein
MKELNEDSLQAARTLRKALADQDWGMRIFHSGNMTRRTLAEFAPYEPVAEVKQLTDTIRRGEPVDGLLLKYAKRRYIEKEDIRDPEDLNRWFEQVIQDNKAILFKPGPDPNSRYVVYSERHRCLAVLARDGRRVSVYKHDGKALGEPWWVLEDLIQTLTP